MVRQVLGDERSDFLSTFGCCMNDLLNMTYLALFFSRYINGVSQRHESISQNMFQDYPVNSVTNGVHALTWTTSPFRRLYDQHIPEWRRDNLYLRYATCLPLDEIITSHMEIKRELLSQVHQRTGTEMNPEVFYLLVHTLVSVRMQRVHKVFRTFLPSSYTVTCCKFGLNFRLVVFFDQGRLRPNFVVFPHSSHFAMTCFLVQLQYLNNKSRIFTNFNSF